MADPPPPPPSPRRIPFPVTTAEILRQSFRILISSLPALLLVTSLIFLLRLWLLAGTVRLAALADDDPALRSILSRLSSSSDSFAGHQPPRRAPFLPLARAGTLLDDDFFSDPDLTLRHRPSHVSNYSFVLFSPAATSLTTNQIPLPPSHSSPIFLSIPSTSSSPAASSDDEGPRSRLFPFGLNLDPNDLSTILQFLLLFTSSHIAAISFFVFFHATSLGIIFVSSAKKHLHLPLSSKDVCLIGAFIGLRHLPGFVFLRWAARDALVQILSLWFFASISDQAHLFKLFVAVKLMPFSIYEMIPWPQAANMASLSGFLFAWALLDTMLSTAFVMVPWVLAVDTNPRRLASDAFSEGYYMLMLMPGTAVMLKWWETVLCGSFGRLVLAMLVGKSIGSFLHTLLEVYFMVAWSTFYFAARSKETVLTGRDRSGLDEFAAYINRLR